MYKHLLIPTDGSELARMALMHGLYFARAINAKVTVLTVEVSSQSVHDPANSPKRAAEILQGAIEDAELIGVSCDTLHIRHENEYGGIIRAAHENGCDIIVMASHGRSGISAVVLGSVTSKVLSHSTVPVLVYRSMWPIQE